MGLPLLLLLLAAVVVGGQPRAECTTQETFLSNMRREYVRPIMDPLTIVMAPSDATTTTVPVGCALDLEDHLMYGGLTDSCAASGVDGIFDTINVHARLWLGIPIPTFNPHMCVFNACSRISSAAELRASGHQSRVNCRRATKMARCALFNLYWIIPYAVVTLACIVALGACTCCCWWCRALT